MLTQHFQAWLRDRNSNLTKTIFKWLHLATRGNVQTRVVDDVIYEKALYCSFTGYSFNRLPFQPYSQLKEGKSIQYPFPDLNCEIGIVCPSHIALIFLYHSYIIHYKPVVYIHYKSITNQLVGILWNLSKRHGRIWAESEVINVYVKLLRWHESVM